MQFCSALFWELSGGETWLCFVLEWWWLESEWLWCEPEWRWCESEWTLESWWWRESEWWWWDRDWERFNESETDLELSQLLLLELVSLLLPEWDVESLVDVSKFSSSHMSLSGWSAFWSVMVDVAAEDCATSLDDMILDDAISLSSWVFRSLSML